jgi:hypothetical protein
MIGADQPVPAVRRARDRELARSGWIRRFTASPPRLVELRELYEGLGHAVLLDPVLPGELATECEGCTLALTMFRVIYTRPGTPPETPDHPDPAAHAGGGSS